MLYIPNSLPLRSFKTKHLASFTPFFALFFVFFISCTTCEQRIYGLVDLLGFFICKPTVTADAGSAVWQPEKTCKHNTNVLLYRRWFGANFYCKWCITVNVLLRTVKLEDLMAKVPIKQCLRSVSFDFETPSIYDLLAHLMLR